MLMNRLQAKNHIISLLRSEDLDKSLSELSKLPEKHQLGGLFSCLCHPEELVRWHAVSGFGVVVPAIAASNMEAARTVMRRFLWMLNDESGGIGWGVPESMAEVMFHSRPLAGEYLHMLVSYTMDDGPELFQDGNFIEQELLQAGVLWGLCRVAQVYREELIGLRLDRNMKVYLSSPNSRVKGMACRLGGLLGLPEYGSLIAAACEDPRPVRIYHEGSFLDQTVAELAESALRSL